MRRTPFGTCVLLIEFLRRANGASDQPERIRVVQGAPHVPMTSERLARQVAFLVEADKLKAILRRTPLTDNSRQENSAEHSWHLAVAAIALHEYAPEGTDLLRALELVAVH